MRSSTEDLFDVYLYHEAGLDGVESSFLFQIDSTHVAQAGWMYTLEAHQLWLEPYRAIYELYAEADEFRGYTLYFRSTRDGRTSVSDSRASHVRPLKDEWATEKVDRADWVYVFEKRAKNADG